MPLGIPHSAFLDWPDEDQDKALAYVREKATICTGCGTRQVEWDEDRFAYVSDSRQCPGCELLAMEQDNIQEGALGVRSFLVRRAQAEMSDEND